MYGWITEEGKHIFLPWSGTQTTTVLGRTTWLHASRKFFFPLGVSRPSGSCIRISKLRVKFITVSIISSYTYLSFSSFPRSQFDPTQDIYVHYTRLSQLMAISPQFSTSCTLFIILRLMWWNTQCWYLHCMCELCALGYLANPSSLQS